MKCQAVIRNRQDPELTAVISVEINGENAKSDELCVFDVLGLPKSKVEMNANYTVMQSRCVRAVLKKNDK